MTIANDFSELRALVVDDNIDAATSFSHLLQLLGCRTAVAFGGAMGQRVAQLFKPAIVFLDLDMPGRDGCEVLGDLRQPVDAHGNPLFICLTGRTEEPDRARCLAAGFDHFVNKPMPPDLLAGLLAEARKRTGTSAAQRPARSP